MAESVNMLVVFWIIGILFSSIYYLVVRKKFYYSFFESIIFTFGILLFEILGAKSLFLLENLNSFNLNYLRLDGGYSLFGVFLFTPAFLLILSIIMKKDIKNLLDYFISGMFIELAFYRVGCIFSGCCGGIDINLFGKVYAFPTRVFEIVFCISIFIYLMFIKLKKQKEPIYIYIVSILSYGIFRFFLEFFRKRTIVVFQFSITHFISIFIILSGFILLRLYTKGNLKTK